MSITTWRNKLIAALECCGESVDSIVSNTMSDKQMDVAFDDGFGSSEGIPFTVWTVNRVYFPACYDGSEWIASVPRNPNGEPVRHIGGE